ncbi:MAG: hypothetical protein ABWZ03_05200, partial [Solirubrobacterales bacterium]
MTSTINASTAARPRRVDRPLGIGIWGVGIGKSAQEAPHAAVGQANHSPPECQQLLTRLQDSLRLYDQRMAEEFCDVGRGVTLCYET